MYMDDNLIYILMYMYYKTGDINIKYQQNQKSVIQLFLVQPALIITKSYCVGLAAHKSHNLFGIIGTFFAWMITL